MLLAQQVGRRGAVQEADGTTGSSFAYIDTSVAVATSCMDTYGIRTQQSYLHVCGDDDVDKLRAARTVRAKQNVSGRKGLCREFAIHNTDSYGKLIRVVQ